MNDHGREAHDGHERFYILVKLSPDANKRSKVHLVDLILNNLALETSKVKQARKISKSTNSNTAVFADKRKEV